MKNAVDRVKTELPPRTRRILLARIMSWKSAGTTSAYAENTFGRKQPKKNTRNYLRVRGEYFSMGLVPSGA